MRTLKQWKQGNKNHPLPLHRFLIQPKALSWDSLEKGAVPSGSGSRVSGIFTSHMRYKKQSEPLTQAQRDSIDGSLNTIRENLDFLVALTPVERKRLSKMGARSRGFVEDAIAAGIRNPGLLPRSLDPEEMRRQLALTDQIRGIAASVAQLNERLTDTLTLLGSQLFEDARLVYRMTRTHAGQDDGLKSATEALARRFTKQGRRAKSAELTPEPA